MKAQHLYYHTSETEIEDNEDNNCYLNSSDTNYAYFVSTNNLKDDTAIVEENSDYLESSDGIYQEKNNEEVFAEVFKVKKRKRNDSNDQSDSEYVPKQRVRRREGTLASFSKGSTLIRKSPQ